MPLFESYERRIAQIQPILDKYGFANVEAANEFCLSKGVDVRAIVHGIQPIAFENAVWAYTLGCAIAMKENCVKAAESKFAYVGIYFCDAVFFCKFLAAFLSS